MSINFYTGDIKDIKEAVSNTARLRETPKGEIPAEVRAQAEVAVKAQERNAAVEFLASQRTAQGEASHCGKSTYISGIACSDAAKALLADLFAVAPTAKGRSI